MNEELFEEIERFGPMGKEIAGEPIAARKIHASMSISVKDNGIFLRDFERRQAFVERYAWAVPSEDAIEEIVKFVGNGKIIEIGSGLGLWAKLIHDRGISIKATDNYDRGFHRRRNNFYPVRRLSYAEALDLYGNRDVLFLCWPPYKTPVAHHALNLFNGDKLIYIGERKEGKKESCTGDEPFFHRLSTRWKRVKTVEIIRWPLIRDKMVFYARK